MTGSQLIFFLSLTTRFLGCCLSRSDSTHFCRGWYQFFCVFVKMYVLFVLVSWLCKVRARCCISVDMLVSWPCIFAVLYLIITKIRGRRRSHSLSRQATRGSAASLGSRYTSCGCSRAGVIARCRHSLLMYCTNATSISKLHFRQAFWAWRVSIHVHLMQTHSY